MDIKRQTLIITIGNIINLYSLWLLTVTTTRNLGYEAVGELTLAMSVGNIFTFIQLYGMRNYQSSDIANEFTTGDYLWTRIITCSIGIFLCFFFAFFSNYTSSVRLSIVLFVLFRTFEALSDVFFGDIQKAGHLEYAGFSLALRGIMTALLFYAGVKGFKDLNKALLLISLGSLLLTVILDLGLYRRFVSWGAGTSSGCCKILKKCFPLLLAVLLPVIINAAPRITLEKYSGPELLGYYGNISTPAVIITTVVPSVLAALMPVYGELIIKRDFTGIRKLWLKTVAGTVGILMACLLGVALMGKAVLSWIYTPQIAPYVHYLYYVLISTALYAFTMCGASALTALRKNNFVSMCAIIATAVCLIITIPLVSVHGIAGAIAVLIISYLVQTIIQAVMLIKLTKPSCKL